MQTFVITLMLCVSYYYHKEKHFSWRGPKDAHKREISRKKHRIMNFSMTNTLSRFWKRMDGKKYSLCFSVYSAVCVLDGYWFVCSAILLVQNICWILVAKTVFFVNAVFSILRLRSSFKNKCKLSSSTLPKQ